MKRHEVAERAPRPKEVARTKLAPETVAHYFYENEKLLAKDVIEEVDC